MDSGQIVFACIVVMIGSYFALFIQAPILFISPLTGHSRDQAASGVSVSIMNQAIIYSIIRPSS